MDTDSIAQVRALYDESADAYDEMMDQEIELPVYAEVLGALAERIADLDGPVLDSSCGSGHMLARFEERYAPGRGLIGVDLSPRMVTIARRRLSNDATVTEGDMRDLGYVPDDSCAALLSFFALHHVGLEDMRACFVEWRRVLKPDGQLVVATWEGQGAIEYGEQLDVVGLRYGEQEVVQAASEAGFRIDTCVVAPVEGMDMDAVYLTATARKEISI